MLTVEDFGAFFAACNDGHAPFAWQRRLLSHLATHGAWPERIAAPTGAGKSNVVDVHVFANALFASGGRRVPRRLATVVDRRALVDSQFLRAQRILSLLESADEGVLLRVADALRSLNGTNSSILQVVNLRGGLGAEEYGQRSAWLDDPASCTVLAATPDMWGSRLLLRGYGSAPYARPREAGLLAMDAAVVVDEAHLSRQLLATARRVSELVRREAEQIGVLPLQVVETTATPSTEGGWVSVEVTEEDLEVDPLLARRLLRPKHVAMIEAVEWPTKGAAKDKHIAQLVAEVQEARTSADGALVGCIVNRVATAVAVAHQLEGAGLRVECWVGRKRQCDAEEIIALHPDLMDSKQPQSLDVIVATQTVEVGVDLDVAALVTELAPASALAQRVGRLNRRGYRDAAQIRVLVPRVGPLSDAPPYNAADLEAAREWLGTLASGSQGVSPWALASTPPPVASLPRKFIKVPEAADSYRWAITSTPCFADESLELWLRDDLDLEIEPCSVVLRQPLPENSNDALALLMATPPTAREGFPIPIHEARELARRVLDGEAGPDRRVWLARAGQETCSFEAERALAPGDTLIMAGSCAATLQGVATSQASHAEAVKTYWGDAEFVLVRGQAGDELLRDLPNDPEAATRQLQETLGRPDLQVRLPAVTVDGEVLPWAVIASDASVNDEEVQRWTRSASPPLLSEHSKAVAERAGSLGRDVGMSAELVSTLVAAGEWHDAGKADARFQTLLGPGDHELWAKSQYQSVQEARRAWSASRLPVGWRHEFRSVLCAWPALEGRPDRELICRLVGTSHGRGRGVPALGAELVQAVDPDDLKSLARSLFVDGDWDDLVARTDRRWGVWAMSFLEAVLRAADCSISKEGG